MTIIDKIRIYVLSRDLNLENKDILDAAQKLSISVKSHSSSISAEDARKIKNLINKKNDRNLSSSKSDLKQEEKVKSKPLIIFGFIISLTSIFLLLFTINNKFG